MTILVTGHTGFVGRHIASSLAQKFRVIGMSRSTQHWEEMERKGVINMRSGEIVLMTDAPDVIVMCHASVASGTQERHISALFEANVQFTETIVRNFPSSRILYLSTTSVYDSNSNSIKEKSAVSPKSDYAISKYWGELVASKNQNCAILRASSIYGNGMNEGTIIPTYCRQALANRTIKVWGKGQRTQNYIHIDDLIQMVHSLTIGQFTGVCLASSPAEITNLELAQIIAKLTHSAIQFEGEDFTPSLCFDNSWTRNELRIGSFTVLCEGLKTYLEWMAKQ